METFKTKPASHLVVAVGLWTAIVLTAQGCATSKPLPIQDDRPYKERAETQVQGDLTVAVALPTAAEAADIYGLDLAEMQIQPVWIEVRNDSDVPTGSSPQVSIPTILRRPRRPMRSRGRPTATIRRWTSGSTSGSTAYSSEIRSCRARPFPASC